MKKLLPPLFFLVISAILIFSWFRFGFVYGGGDVGLPIYDPKRILDIAKYVWWEAAAPGYPVPQGLTSAPLLFILSFFQILGFSPVILQALLFFSLLILMGFGMYLLALSLFGKENSKWAILAGFFYMFNPYMMIQIWHRFVHTSMVLVAVLPFMILFWRGWIKTAKFKFLLFFLLTNFLGVYLFGTIAYVVTVWLVLFLITFFEAFIPWSGFRVIIKLSILFLVGLIFWFLTNIWWFIPTFTTGASFFSEQHTTEESLVTLINISKQAAVPYTLQLINPFYLFYQQELGTIYQSFIFRTLPWIIVSVLLVGLVQSLKQKVLAHFGFIFLIIIFLTKGASSPFGFLFQWGFSSIFFLGALRNPFEKIGIILPLFAAILFVAGLKIIVRRFGKLPIIVVVLLLVIFAHPMFLGTVFGRPNKSSFILPPQSYQDADTWIKNQNLQGKILHLPLSRAEDITYNWEYGYSGVEPSNLFFTSNPSISRGFNIRAVDNVLTALSLAFIKPMDKDKILELLQAFDVRFIVLHKDVKWQGRDIYDPKEAEIALDDLDFIQKEVFFGDLVIYKLKDKYYQGRIMLFDNPTLVYPNDNIIFEPWLAKSGGVMVTPMGKSDDKIFLEKSLQTLIFARSSFEYSPVKDLADFQIQIRELERIIPSFQFNGEIQTKELALQIIKASNLLQNIRSEQGLQEYKKAIAKVFDKELDSSRLPLYFKKINIAKIFDYHLRNLGEFENSINLKQYLIKNNLLPRYESKEPSNFRQYFHFHVPKTQEYEILMSNSESSKIYPGGLEKIKLQVNEKNIELPTEIKGDFISFGKMQLEEGDNEIGFDAIASNNLVTGTITNFDSDSFPVYGADLYKVSFRVQLQSGQGFNLQILQNNELTFDQLVQVPVGVLQTIEFITPPMNKNAKWAKLRFLTKPKDDLLIQNLKIERILNNEIFLKADGEPQDSTIGKVEFRQKDPVFYSCKIKLERPSFLLFKESFHPGWQLKLTENGKKVLINKHYIGNLYGNAYFLEKEGEYNFELEFEPQKNVTRGIYLAGFGWVGVLVLLLVRRKYEKI